MLDALAAVERELSGLPELGQESQFEFLGTKAVATLIM
jgi:hypothetical protein